MSAIISTGVQNVEMEGVEELLLGQEHAEGEEVEQQVGFLTASGGKHYVFIPQETTPLSQKCCEMLSETEKPKDQKLLDAKGEAKHLSYEESDPIRTKEFQVQKSEKGTTDTQKEALTHAKADQTGRRSLETATGRPLPTRPKGRERFETREFTRSSKEGGVEKKREQVRSEKRETSSRPSSEKSGLREQAKGEYHELTQLREKEERDEGFSEENRNQHEDEEPQEEENKARVEGVNPKELLDYCNQESALLSELLKMRVSQFDVLLLFLEVMKLSLKGREEERRDRMVERELQLQHIQNMVDNFKSQAQNYLFSNLGSGLMSIVSGLAPIVGHLKGDWLMDRMAGIPILDRFQDMPSKDFFKQVSKITFAMSEMQKGYGQVRNTFAESSRTYDQHMADIRKTDWDEDTRTMDEIKDQWKNFENFLYQSLQMYHDTTRQLYS